MPDEWLDDYASEETRARPGFEEELADALVAAWRDGSPLAAAAVVSRVRLARSLGWVAVAAAVAMGVVLITTQEGGHMRPVGPAPTTTGEPRPFVPCSVGEASSGRPLTLDVGSLETFRPLDIEPTMTMQPTPTNRHDDGGTVELEVHLVPTT